MGRTALTPGRTALPRPSGRQSATVPREDRAPLVNP